MNEKIINIESKEGQEKVKIIFEYDEFVSKDLIQSLILK